MSGIDDVKQRLDIVEVLGGYVRLDKAGRNFKALCPFHQEKTPSFFVFPDRQSWRCFGCSAGGDVFSFVMKRENVDFSQALKMLADKAGVSLEPKKVTVESRLGESLFSINEAAAQYYHELLLRDRAGQSALEYVRKRGLNDKAVADFLLGYSSSEGLKRHLVARGYKESELAAAGLIGEKDGRTYDLFRHRLMFPIRDIKGRVVGFGARALDNSQPKYLNSPQTAVFDKSSILYGIDLAKGAIREAKLAVIVEGYMDVITAHQHGMANVVGSMGTALTEKQIGILGGLTKRLAFALDPDAAGDAGTLRGIDVALRSMDRKNLEMGTWLGAVSRLRGELRIISLPPGKDPDDVIRENSEEWRRLVEHALPFMDHLLTVVASKVDLSTPEGKSQASEQLLPLIAELEDDTQREFYLGKLASLLGIREKVLLDKAGDLRRTRSEKAARAPARPASVLRLGDALEEYCLSVLLQHPELREQAGALSPEHFERSENREVLLGWRSTSTSEELAGAIGEDLRGHLNVLLARGLPPADEPVWEKALADCMRRLQERRLRLQEEVLTSESVSMVVDGQEMGTAGLAALQEKPVELNAQLVKSMQERTGQPAPKREDQ